ncbi:MAG: hypothetical protein CM15mP102_14520 [Flavobacteriales bacterium]|nr:MAG: hypothetical protein CM15mP102_14520 [Flavobacteriales bacterium]
MIKSEEIGKIIFWDSSKNWNSSLHDGVYSSNSSINLNSNNLQYSTYLSQLVSVNNDGYDLIMYSKIGMGDGQQANNPWLQEFPDPLTRVSWDNYITVSKFDAEKLV